jgi:glycosyltransferase involved in cell wall biosynthesis
MYKYMSRLTDAFFFTAAEQGKHWFKDPKLLKKIMPVMEGAPVFNLETMDQDRIFEYVNRNESRIYTNISGSPVFLWVGTLNENKDPLTILNGFEKIFEEYAAAALYMIYNGDKLLQQVQTIIANSDILKDRVHLLGKIPHESMQSYYNSADYFVLGSHYEGSGFALSEALSCGCIPIVTNIPSFSAMTGKGELGALWNVGNADSFVHAVGSAMQKPLEEEAIKCIEFYKKNLSYNAIADIAVKHYQKIISSRNKK